jgi:hypothetical protein
MTKLKIKEGDLFVVPVETFFILGLITRISDMKVPFGYFYYPKFEKIPKKDEVELDNYKVLFSGKFGVQGFKDGTWKIIGSLSGFERKDWPLPVFYHKHDILPDQLVYLDDNLDEYKREKALLSEKEYENLPRTGLGGSEYIEKKLSKLLLALI